MTTPRYALSLLVSLLVCVCMMGRPQIGDGAAGDPKAAPRTAAPAATTSTPEIAPRRPGALVPLYISFAALQALDIHSTLRAPAYGGREANPVVDGMLGSPAAFVAAKAGVTAAVCVASERLWKRNKAAAIVTMIALDSAYAAIVAHNYALEARGAAPR